MLPNEERKQEDVELGEPVSANDKFFLAWGLESLKGSVPALNDSLQKIVVLDTALIGGGLVGVKEGVLLHWWALVTLLILVVSLVAALYGAFPRGRNVNLLDPDDIKNNEYEAINRKYCALRIAFIALAVGLFIAVVSLAFRGPAPQPAATSSPSIPTAID